MKVKLIYSYLYFFIVLFVLAGRHDLQALFLCGVENAGNVAKEIEKCFMADGPRGENCMVYSYFDYYKPLMLQT